MQAPVQVRFEYQTARCDENGVNIPESPFQVAPVCHPKLDSSRIDRKGATIFSREKGFVHSRGAFPMERSHCRMILPFCRLLCRLSHHWNPAQSDSECRKADDLHAACPYFRKHRQSLPKSPGALG
jgi:hypothetical protein